jgi:septal ring-binding cell division protein DamX
MRHLCAITSLALIGCGLGLANSATADVVLLTQERSATAFNGTTTRSSTAAGFSDFSANRLFYQSGTNGYWNGAAQYSTFLPDGATGTGQSIYAEGSVRSEAFGTFKPSTTWTTSTVFKTTFQVTTPHLMNIFVSTNATGSGSVMASLKQGTSAVWSLSGAGNENLVKSLSVGTYTLELTAASSLDSLGYGGDALFQMGVGFAVPGPSALCMVALSAFLRRRRT